MMLISRGFQNRKLSRNWFHRSARWESVWN